MCLHISYKRLTSKFVPPTFILLKKTLITYPPKVDTAFGRNYYKAGIMKNGNLGSLESILMLAVMRLGDDAYGVSIRHELLTRAKKDVAIGAIYTAFERLERKGFVESWLGNPTAIRGGRAKRYYRLTPGGLKILNETQRAIQGLMAGLNFAGGTVNA
jgi:PadR family transcriptional regulator, regulatory protein PadR